MLARKKISTQKTIIMVGIIAVVWIIIGFLAYANFGNKKSNSTGEKPYSQLIDFGKGDGKSKESLNNWPNGVEILNDDRYTRLKTYGEVPVTVEPKDLGRSNPFEPVPSQPSATQPKK